MTKLPLGEAYSVYNPLLHEVPDSDKAIKNDVCAINTLKDNFSLWLCNIRKNMKHLIKEDIKTCLDLPKEGYENAPCIVIAHGPSLYDSDFELLKTWNGKIICVNKALKPLLERGIIPDWVVCVESVIDVRNQFINDIVIEHASKINAFILTDIDLEVADFITKHFKETYWATTTTPDNAIPNLTEVAKAITGIPPAKPASNVGVFTYMISTDLKCNPIGLLGFDLSFKQSEWKEAYEPNFKIHYNYKRKEIYGLTTAFAGYVNEQRNAIISAKGNGIDTYNLTPCGALLNEEAIISIGLKEFIERFNP